jgi:Protein of unknown function (DUF4038)/Putative collagen-binding domain of a collagenase
MIGTLTVDLSGRYLRRDGQPWFLLGDTAWELFRALRGDEVEHYLRRRAAQGFNTVLAVALSEFDGLRMPTVDGLLPFHELDPERPQAPYWQHLDHVIRRANTLGLTVGLLPTWGSNWHDDPPFFDRVSARRYAAWIAQRYRDDDIIWVLGGDRPVTTPEHRAVLDAFAGGIRSVVSRRHLVTAHPNGCHSSSDHLADAPWLDFHLLQSGHAGWGVPGYQMVEQDYAIEPAKPVLDAEPNYDSHPVMTRDWRPIPDAFFDEHDVRRAAYQSVFAGAAGHVYGCHEIWQMNDPSRAQPKNLGRLHWRDALELPGARQMGLLARLAGQVGLFDWAPAQELIPSGRGILGGHQRAMARRDGRPGALVYAPLGRPVRLDLGRWSGLRWRARWWDPREGTWSTGDGYDTGRFTVAHPYPGLDAVLQLEPR